MEPLVCDNDWAFSSTMAQKTTSIAALSKKTFWIAKQRNLRIDVSPSTACQRFVQVQKYDASGCNF